MSKTTKSINDDIGSLQKQINELKKQQRAAAKAKQLDIINEFKEKCKHSLLYIDNAYFCTIKMDCDLKHNSIYLGDSQFICAGYNKEMTHLPYIPSFNCFALSYCADTFMDEYNSGKIKVYNDPEKIRELINSWIDQYHTYDLYVDNVIGNRSSNIVPSELLNMKSNSFLDTIINYGNGTLWKTESNYIVLTVISMLDGSYGIKFNRLEFRTFKNEWKGMDRIGYVTQLPSVSESAIRLFRINPINVNDRSITKEIKTYLNGAVQVSWEELDEKLGNIRREVREIEPTLADTLFNVITE